jgi:DivIVA domain-containing protein
MKAEAGVPGMRNSGHGGGEPRPQFKLAMRGYDPGEVEEFLARVPDDPDLPVPGFARVMRGYDPEEVDLYIEHVKALSRRLRPPT